MKKKQQTKEEEVRERRTFLEICCSEIVSWGADHGEIAGRLWSEAAKRTTGKVKSRLNKTG